MQEFARSRVRVCSVQCIFEHATMPEVFADKNSVASVRQAEYYF